jgi:hypothetical protein
MSSGSLNFGESVMEQHTTLIFQSPLERKLFPFTLLMIRKNHPDMFASIIGRRHCGYPAL